MMLPALIVATVLASPSLPVRIPIDEPPAAPAATRAPATVSSRPEPPALTSIPTNHRVNDPAQVTAGIGELIPALAVNGYDALIVWRVVGSLPTQRLRAAYSYDGGNTWSDLGWLPDLPVNWRWGVDPCVEVDPSSGKFLIAAQTVNPVSMQTGIAFVTAQPILGALSWSTPSIIHTTGWIGAFYADQLEMTFDPWSYALTIAFGDGYVAPQKLVYLLSADLGASWYPPQTVLTGTGLGVGPRIAYSGYLGPLIVHTNFPSLAEYYDGSIQSSRTNFGSWSAPVTVSAHRFDPGSPPGAPSDYVTPPTLDVDKTNYLYQNRVYSAWIQSAKLSPWPAGGPFNALESEPNDVTPQFLGGFTGLVTSSMSSNSDVDLYSVDLTAHEHLVILPWTLGSTGINTNIRYEILAADGTHMLGYFAFAAADIGDARVLFTAPRTATYFVRVTAFNASTYEFQVARSFDAASPARDRRELMTSFSVDLGQSWSTPAPLYVGDIGFDVAMAELAVANDGRPYLFWLDYSEAHPDGALSKLKVTRSSDGGTSWETPQTISSVATDWQSIPGGFKTGWRIEAATTPIPTELVVAGKPGTNYYTSAEDLHVAWIDGRDGEGNVYTAHFPTGFEVLFVQNDTTAAPGDLVGLRMVLENRNTVFPEIVTPSFIACQRANWESTFAPFAMLPGSNVSLYPVAVQIPDTAAAGTVFYQAAITLGPQTYGINTFIHVTPNSNAVGDPVVPRRFEPPTPNPAATGTTFRFALGAGEEAALEIFDVAGSRVRTLAEGALGAGAHLRAWDLRDDAGRRVAPGVYLAQLTAGGRKQVYRVAVLR